MYNCFVVLGCFLFFSPICCTQPLDDKAFVYSLVDYLSIHHVIFLKTSEDMSNYINIQRSYSQVLYTSILSYADIAEIAKRGLIDYINSLVCIYSNDNNSTISDLIKISEEMDISLLKWVVITEEYDPKKYEPINIPYNCEFVVAEVSESGEYILTEIYDTISVSKLTVHLGKWSPEYGLEASELGFYSRRSNLANTVFNISSNHEDPCSVSSFQEMAGNVLKCIHHFTFNMMATMNNFSINWILMDRYGGFVEEVYPPDIHFSLYEINGFVGENVGLIWPTMRVDLEVFASYAGHVLGWSTFVYPFSKGMWMAVFIWFFVSAVVISSIEFLTMNLDKTEPPKTCFKLWFKYVFLSFSAFCNQSEGDDPDRSSLKILLFLIFLIPTALVPGYSAALTSALTVKNNKMPFTNLEELSKAKDYKLGYQATMNLSFFYNVETSDEVIRTLVRDIIVPQDQLPNVEAEGARRICSDKFSFMASRYAVLAAMPQCSYFALERPLFVVFVSLPVRMNFPYRHLIDRSIRKLLYRAVISVGTTRVVDQSLILYIPNEKIAMDDLSPIMIHNVVTIFTGLCFGILASVLIVFTEIIYYKSTKSKLKLKY